MTGGNGKHYDDGDGDGDGDDDDGSNQDYATNLEADTPRYKAWLKNTLQGIK